MAKTKKEQGDDGEGFRYALNGMPSQMFKTQPEIGEVWDCHVQVRVIGHVSEAMAREGTREVVKMRVLEVQLVERSEVADPNVDPNQTTIDDAAEANTDLGDFPAS